MTRRRLAGPVFLLCLLAWTAPTLAADAEPAVPKGAPSKFIRLDRDAAGEPQGLQTAIVRYTSTDPAQGDLVVDLVGAVHVGDKSYYESLNKQFETYDVVLYELVAPPGTRVPKGSKTGGHPVAMLQNGLKDMLQLEHQLEQVDYTKDNMVHADMSADEFAKSMKDHNENFFTLFFRMMGQAMAQQALQKNKSNGSEIDLLSALFDKNRSGAVKRVIAEQFENLDGMMDALGGTVLITERNKVVIKKLAEQIAGGKKKVAIFFGAGHMSDIEKQLVADFRLRRASEQWLTAWKLEDAPAEPKPAAKKPSARISPRRLQSTPLGVLAHLFIAQR